LLFAARPYKVECNYEFDTKSDFSTSNHTDSCSSILGMTQEKIEHFALEFGKTFRYLPSVINGEMQLDKRHKQTFRFVCE